MARPEAKYSYGSTSEHEDDLAGDEGGADWKKALIDGAIKGDHINAGEYNTPGDGFESPKDDCSSQRGRFGGPDSLFERDHLDAPFNRFEYPPAVKRGPPSNDRSVKASAARARATCSDECDTGRSDERWYGSLYGRDGDE
jgi:hypothetical protein